ncbi:protein of unknown function (plasmid) [Azospirillum baldaniorum]|uniref:Uncharacterized protein n=1 Tax=Azospirillum baldaniorum TaxID=1064539 RepID=A0A9P1NQR6_9PROT|nr:protein of unknown function [Azospirillum baldaniorum]
MNASMMSDCVTTPFSGQELASAIIAAALSLPSANGRLHLPNGAVLCDPAALERGIRAGRAGAVPLAGAERAAHRRGRAGPAG